MLNDELADLEIFAAVADARSFTRAAAAAFHGAGLAIVMVAPFIATNSQCLNEKKVPSRASLP